MRVPFELNRQVIDDIDRGRTTWTGNRRRTPHAISPLPRTAPCSRAMPLPASAASAKGQQNRKCSANGGFSIWLEDNPQKQNARPIDLRGQGSYQNWMTTLTCAGTGLPFCRAGSYVYCWSVSIAALRSLAGPDRTFIDFTCPDISTTASSVTLPETKSCSASSGGLGRTALTSFGGTVTSSTEEDGAETKLVFVGARSKERLATEVINGGFPVTDG